MSELVKYSEQTFESIKHVNEYGEEYWLARELQPVLEYAQWRRFIGGCSGNTQGVASLVEGMDAEEVISRLKGIKCGFKNTSCPDQLSTALEEVLNK